MLEGSWLALNTEIRLDSEALGKGTTLDFESGLGARARVEAVEVIAVDSIEPDRLNGFSARVIWTVGGTVTHFGHRLFRQNRYDARVSLVPDNDVWKIRGVEVFDEERVR